MAKESFVLYKSFYGPIEDLTDQQLGKLLRSIFQYQINGDENVDQDILMVFKFFKNQFRLDEEKYKRVVNRNKLNGSEGGRPKKPKKATGLFENPKKPLGYLGAKKPDNEKDNVNENVKEKKKFLKISFPESEVFDKHKFKTAFPEWNRAKLAHYHAAADQYSTEGHKYVDWKKTVAGWARKSDAEGKMKFPDEQEKKSSFTTGV